MAPIVDEIRENRLRWFGHILRREGTAAVRVVKVIYVERTRGTGDQIRDEGIENAVWGRV